MDADYDGEQLAAIDRATEAMKEFRAAGHERRQEIERELDEIAKKVLPARNSL